MKNYILIFLMLSTVLFSKPIYEDDEETVDEARAIIEKNIISNPRALEFDFGELDGSDLERVVKVMRREVNEHNISIKEIDNKGLVIKIRDAFHLPNYLIHKNSKGKIISELVSDEGLDIEFANIKRSNIKVGDTIEIFEDKRYSKKIINIVIK